MDPTALLAAYEAGGKEIINGKAQAQQLAAENQELKARVQDLEALIGKLNRAAAGATGG
jgi:cell division protein FtsB